MSPISSGDRDASLHRIGVVNLRGVAARKLVAEGRAQEGGSFASASRMAWAKCMSTGVAGYIGGDRGGAVAAAGEKTWRHLRKQRGDRRVDRVLAGVPIVQNEGCLR
jgi:hypothetical protein